MERTLVILKPDAIQRLLVGRIVSRLEDKGLKVVAMKMLQVTDELARRMYAVHEGKDFYEPLVEFITSSPVVATVWEGKDVIAVVRKVMGPTFGADAPGGTIRGDFGMTRRFNLIHGSDSRESAAREIPIFFGPQEMVEYTLRSERWVYGA